MIRKSKYYYSITAVVPSTGVLDTAMAMDRTDITVNTSGGSSSSLRKGPGSSWATYLVALTAQAKHGFCG
jgi:hypothetical protein